MEHEGAEHAMDGEHARTSLTVEVSNAMVQLYTEHLGGEPTTQGTTEWAGDDMLLSKLSETFTPAERKLVEMGEHHRLRDSRLFMHHTVDSWFVAAVERIVGRKVAAHVSGVNVSRDISSEVFCFQPRMAEG